MTKTIEEAAKSFANREYEIGQVDWDALYKGYYHGIKDFLAKPLRDRLTEAEKERVRKMYKEAVEGKCELEKMQPQNTHAKNSIAMKIGVNMGRILALESIFGSDFFKEGE